MSSAPSRNTILACHVHKFGGSSLADAARMRAIAPLLDDGAGARLVVVSAMLGTTNALVELATIARAGGDWAPDWQGLRQRHLQAAATLDDDDRFGLQAVLADGFDSLRKDLETLAADCADGERIAARVHGSGEVWSSWLVQAALGGERNGWQRLDAREVLVVHPGEMGVGVDWEESRRRFAAWRERHPGRDAVITGFIARDAQGRDTTLGRNGSDYSAAIFANLCDADALTIWTDVDGVLSADPRLVPDAVCLPSLSYAEACELAYFGAGVLHPQTLAPVQSRGIPLRIRNTLRPQAPGTWVMAQVDAASAPIKDTPVKGLSLVRDLAVLELSGTGMVGVPGTAERLFAALPGHHRCIQDHRA